MIINFLFLIEQYILFLYRPNGLYYISIISILYIIFSIIYIILYANGAGRDEKQVTRKRGDKANHLLCMIYKK